MSFTDLQAFVRELEARGEVRRIRAEVDPKLELAEIHRRVIAEQGPALIFERVKGSPFPVVTNLFGTKSRTELAFGRRGPELVAQLPSLVHELMPPSWQKLWEKRKTLTPLASVGLKTKKGLNGDWVIERNPNLEALPLLTGWSEDGGPFLTLPLVYTEHPKTRLHNLGMYRMQRFDRATMGLHMQIAKGGGFHLSAAGEMGANLPVHVFLGGPPVAILAAIAPLPENVPELLLASLMLGKKLELIRDSVTSLPILGNAEFVLVGHSIPSERRPEGPFGDHYGYYSLQHDFPVFHCTTVLRKKNPLYPATVVGKPRQEDYYIGNYLQELLSPLFPLAMPGVKDLWSYGETGYHSLAAAVLQHRYKREAMVHAFRILGEGQLSLTKFLIAVDKPLDLKNFREVLEHVLERADFRSDLYVFSHLSMDTLDYTGPKLNEGSKAVLLGMGEPRRQLLGELEDGSGQLSQLVSKARVYCRGCLVVSGENYSAKPNLAKELTACAPLEKWPLVILCDNADFTAHDMQSFLWSTFTRFEPARDIYGKSVILERFHASLEAPIVIDARMKPGYPDELFCDPETERLVDRRWGEYWS